LALIIYLDESGDLGWNFPAGSSRYLTIGTLCTPPIKKHIPKRVIKDLYQHFGWNTANEQKWARMVPQERAKFAELARKMCIAHPDIILRCITVQKENVMKHIREDSNKIYNYMIGLNLSELMAQHDRVTIVPDPRSLKVKSGNSCHDYLQTLLWFFKNVPTILQTIPQDSKSCRCIQFSDMLSGLVRSHYEHGEQVNYQVLSPYILQKRLYFR
jgi:hypothetical protein